jgi:radical SAM protein with 4Fe4S-binding SPASM domain
MLNHIRNFARFKRHQWIHDLESDLHKLRYLFWESTRRCNLDCLHCGSDCGRDDDLPGLPRETVERVLARIADQYDATQIILVVTGGEPLVRRDVPDVLATAGGLGFRFGMVSNGWLLDEQRARTLVGLGMESVVVSLDGPRPDHDWLRNRAGSYERAVRGLTACREAGLPIVEAITCVTPRTLDKLERTYELAVAAGATHWRVFNIFPIGRARDDERLLLTPQGMREFVATMAALRQRGKDEGVVVNLSEEGFLGFDWEDQVRDAPYFCRAGVNIAGLMADGSIAACPNLAPWMAQGNAADDDFVDVWENRYELFRDRSWTQVGDCDGCEQWGVCRGNSLHLWTEARDGPCWCHHKVLHD